MGKYEMNTADMRRFFNDIHAIAVSTKKVADIVDILSEEEVAEIRKKKEAAQQETEEKTKRNLYRLPLEPDPDERG